MPRYDPFVDKNCRCCFNPVSTQKQSISGAGCDVSHVELDGARLSDMLAFKSETCLRVCV